MKNFQFQIFSHKINSTFLIKTELKKALDLFYNKHISLLSDNQRVAILFKINNINNEWRNIGSLQISDKKGFYLLLDVFSW